MTASSVPSLNSTSSTNLKSLEAYVAQRYCPVSCWIVPPTSCTAFLSLSQARSGGPEYANGLTQDVSPASLETQLDLAGQGRSLPW